MVSSFEQTPTAESMTSPPVVFRCGEPVIRGVKSSSRLLVPAEKWSGRREVVSPLVKSTASSMVRIQKCGGLILGEETAIPPDASRLDRPRLVV